MASATTENSYCLVAAADLYFDERLHAEAWNDLEANDPNKDRALIQATKIFDRYLTWLEIPDKTAPDQAIMDACCEMALTLLNGDTQVKDDMEGIDSLSLAGMTIKRGSDRKRIIPSHVYAMISHLASYRHTSGSIELVRS